MYSFSSVNQEALGYKGQYKHGEYWQDYYAITFDKLPTENRQTNKDSSYITYTAHYHSETTIDFEAFSADVEVLLMDRQWKTITHEDSLISRVKIKCKLSTH